MFLAPRLPSPLAGLKEVPKQLVLAKWGRNESVNGSFTVGPKTARVLPAMQKLLGFDTVAIDFEHNTLPGTEAYKADKEPRNIAATSPLQVVEGVGIVAHSPDWTPSGTKSVTEGLHPDLSPVIKTDDAGEVVFIHSAALCRQGAVDGLHAYSAADVFSATQLAAFSAALAAPAQTQSSAMDYKKLLILLLGLQPNASDADIETACTKFADNAGKLQAFSATLDGFKKSLEAIQGQLAQSERGRLVAEAIAAGKLVPHSAEIDKLGNEAFKAVLDALPAGIVPVSQRTPEGLKAHASVLTTSGDAAAEAEVARQMGNDPEKLKKYGEKLR